jgi:hypothetical protein
MEYLIGVALTVLVCAFAMLAGFDRQRVFYPTLVTVIPSYYIVFAAIGHSTPALVLESVTAAGFTALGVGSLQEEPLARCGSPRRTWSFRPPSPPDNSQSCCPRLVARLLSCIRRFRRRVCCRSADAASRICFEGLKLWH